MIARTIPITQVKPDLNDSLRMAVAEIERFLAMFYPAEAINQTDAAKAIAGQWLSRIKGFHQDDDFLHLVRDFLSYVLSGGERSRISDQLAYYFSGFMPSYGAACVLMDMVADGRPWSEVQAFMHSQSYGNARQYVETFDWAGGQEKAQAEIDAWKAVLREQDTKLHTATYGEPILLAQAKPQPMPNGPMTDVPANDPYMPKPRPPLRVVPPPEVAPAGEAAAGESLAARLAFRLLGILLLPLLLSGDTPQQNRNPKALTVPLDQPKADAVTDTANNECKAQIEDNQKNGAVCEDDGYVLMESELKYKRLANPPKGKGLDGLFEKLPAFDQPAPMPTAVTVPKPGKLVFIPPDKKPPRPEYDYVATALGKTALPTYPKFVVFEAKNISKSIDATDTEKLKKETQNRLGNTCDGLQMSEPWTEKRIPRALARKDSGLTPGQQNQKRQEITDAEYARWLFACLPGPVGAAQPSKLYVFIDVIAAGMDLDSHPPKARAPRPGSGNAL